MRPRAGARRWGWLLGLALVWPVCAGAETNTFRVAAYNVRNWLEMERWGEADRPKPFKEKEAVISLLTNLHADVLGLIELGTTNDFADVQQRLRRHGLSYPHQLWIEGEDTNRHVAVLSQFPLVENHSRTDYTYTLGLSHWRVSRGVLDVRVQVNPQYSFRAILVHLKSRRPIPEGDQSLMRLEEARLVRQHVAKVLKANPRENLLLMGDCNDDPDSEPIRRLIGDAPFQLFDLKPVDRQGLFWTHYWSAEDQYSRIDYLLVSPGMQPEYVPGTARIADDPEAKHASDHRAVSARFYAAEHDTLPASGVERDLRARSSPEPALPEPSTPGARGWWWLLGGAALVVGVLLVRSRGHSPPAE